ncbi:hypothetical protein STBHUCCB_29860 [Salmonella enterica subsp. enterica serovar Typhi str. P-stx-12]|nr:hypothetical protein STBHUCCB_29860 [Salmonella enterica subsp. enterica serovar Typhi str. P-stx-12]AXR58884.1 hypothetical protein CJP42_4067 [Salmonella enterica subsp. enterica serovar Typhi]
MLVKRVYPRWRGEHGQQPVSDIRQIGLSPLARGTHANRQSPPRELRFIPAGAGNTHDVCRP